MFVALVAGLDLDRPEKGLTVLKRIIASS